MQPILGLERALAGAVLTFFGFMHSEAIGIGKTPLVALSYLMVAVLLWWCARTRVVSAPEPAALHGAHGATAN